MAITRSLTTAISDGASSGMFKNRIINGDMRIFQRNASLSTNNSYGYFIDRMWGFSGSSTAATYSQITNTGLSGFPYAARSQRNASNTGTNGVYMGQIIESVNMTDLVGQTVTLSFWARAGSNYSPSSNALLVTLRTGTTADQGLAQTISPGWAGQADQIQTITLTTSWQKYVLTYTIPSNALEILPFFFAQVLGTAGTNDYYDVTGLQLEAGTTATNFERRAYGHELALCQRYYYQQKGGTDSIATALPTSYEYSRAYIMAGCQYPVTMRTTPTVTFYSGQTSTINKISGYSSGTEYTVSSLYYGDSKRVGGYIQTSTSMNGLELQAFYYSASAEL